VDGNEIRRRFLRFFEERGHRVVPSSSLISPDPKLLLTTAGMVQFIPYFLGLEQAPFTRATSVQKAFRNTDIDNVGHTARHLTFFEMLGNFSFGDYFKKEAIGYAHELVTEGYGIDHERLWVTVFETDDEAIDLWTDQAGIPAGRIVRRGKFDEHGEPANFWWTHAAGPCGPCSEIYVDRGPRYGADGGPDVDEERFLEIWNLVFTQDECDEDSNVIAELPRKNIDTGSSLERVAVVLQDVGSVFDTDFLRPLVQTAERLTGRRYGRDERDDVSLRIIADHGRATTFLMADGVLPSNEGRGYVLRRMLRRLVTHARKLGVERPVMADLVETTLQLMGETYPELVANRSSIQQVAASEEERFGGTYRHGITLFEEEAAGAKRSRSSLFPGEAAFKLHDTYGFPIESTVELAAQEGLTVDTEAFGRLMEEQRSRAREARRKGGAGGGAVARVASSSGPTEFVGYERLASDARLVALARGEDLSDAASEGDTVQLILDRTPFYAEGGGQVGDAGLVRTPTGEARVTDTRLGPGGIIVHEAEVTSGEVRTGQEAEAAVDVPRREATARSHTATHVLHHTIRSLLGEHARQAGSLVAPGRLRFDFTHYEALPRQSREQMEHVANRRLADDQSVRAYETTFDFARSQGAIALFGEKYGDVVRVVEIGDYSIELCGGTHVHHTGQVALLRLLSEAGIGSGVRRLEALVGPDALEHVNLERRLLEEITEAIGGGDPSQAPERVRQAMARIKQLESELGKIRRAEQTAEVDDLLRRASPVGGASLIAESRAGREAGELRELALKVRGRLAEPGAVVLASAGSGRATLVAALTKDLPGRGVTAGALLEPAARALGGSAGGKPDVAMGGGPRTDAVQDALALVRGRLEALLGGG